MDATLQRANDDDSVTPTATASVAATAPTVSAAPIPGVA
jgi:hypothetical protein